VKTLVSLFFLVFLIGCGGDSSPINSENNDTSKNFLFTGEGLSGKEIFVSKITVEEGLGPHFNAQSCQKCHDTPINGGMGGGDDDLAFRIGTLDKGVFYDLTNGHGGPVSRTHSVTELGYDCAIRAGIPSYATVVSVRSSPTLFGLGDIENIPDETIKAEAIDKGYGVHGKVNLVITHNGKKRVGRFGWKAHKATLNEFTGEAFRNEMGLINSFAPLECFPSNNSIVKECAGYSDKLEISDNAIVKVANFIRELPTNTHRPNSMDSNGFKLFEKVHCSSCHKPSYNNGEKEVYLFSDLLLHNMGDGLNDNFVQANAEGPDWRTMPLRDLASRTHFLHDARTKDLEEAIREHRAEANISKTMYFNLSEGERKEILNFLKTL